MMVNVMILIRLLLAGPSMKCKYASTHFTHPCEYFNIGGDCMANMQICDNPPTTEKLIKSLERLQQLDAADPTGNIGKLIDGFSRKQ
jgi:hypothetical protein